MISPNSPINISAPLDTGINELFIFLADHGNKGTFTINPKEPLYARDLIDQIQGIQDKVNEKIILLYDACYSGSFLSEIEQRTAIDPALANKLLTITSTDPNQIAYFLNQGLVSFSYPFLDEWRLTHSLKGAFDYAGASLPYTDPNQGQTPCISDPALAETWDQDTIYYVNESRPLFGEVAAYRDEGNLRISADIFSLTGIAEVWAIVERYVMDPQYWIYGYEVEGVLRGLVTVSFRWTLFHAGQVAIVEDLVVDEGFRGQSLGTALLDSVENRAIEEERARIVEVNSDLHRDAAHGFWERHGYARLAYQFRKALV